MVPSDRVPALLKWTHESSGHVGADRTLRLFKQWFHTTWTDDQLRKTLQPIVDKCPCRSCKPGDIRDRGLYSTLPIPHCANSVLYVDYTEMPKFGGYDFALVVTCGLTRFTRVCPCTKHITGEETIKILLEEWFCVYGAPKEFNSDEDVRVRSDTGWYKRVLRSLNVEVSTGIPYSHTSNPLCERQIHVLKENVRIWCKTERTRDWVRLLTRSRGGPATGRCGGHAQVSRQAKHYAHRGINALMSCDKAFQDPCHSATRERKYVQQHIRICTHGVKT